MRFRPILAFAAALVPLLLPATSLAQGEAAPERELTFELAVERPGMFLPRARPGLGFSADGSRITWIERRGRGIAMVAEAVADGKVEVLLDEAGLSSAAKDAGIEGLDFRALIDAAWDEAGDALLLDHAGARLKLRLEPPAITVLQTWPEEAEAKALSPDGLDVAWVEDHDVHVKLRDGVVRRVTAGGHEALTHGVSVSRVEFGISDGLWWSPDGRRVAFYQEDLRGVSPYPYVDWSTLPGTLKPGRYPFAGTKNSIVRVGVYDTVKGETVWLDSRPENDEYLTGVTFGPNGDAIVVAHVARSQDHTVVRRYDAATGKVSAVLFEEKDPEWTEPEHGPIFLPDGGGRFLWFSVADGWRHLYLHDVDGKRLQQVTRGAFDVRAFRGFARAGDRFWFEASGEDPRQKHLFSCAFDLSSLDAAERADDAAPAAGIRRVTSGRGTHDTIIAPGDGHVLDVHSHLELPLAVDLLDASGTVLRRIQEAENPFAGFRVGDERFFEAETDDGQPIHGYMITPPGMKEGTRHPVLLYVYGGPHSQMVTDSWMGGMGGMNVWLHHMAAQGMVVIRADGRGTLNRGIDWQQAVHRRLGTLEMQDQLAALDHVVGLGIADPERVGVHGWSYGGFMTLTLMTRAGDRFVAGVAGAPVTDWRFYETGYGERYMDTPAENEEGYATADPGRHVEGLKGDLLIVHGTSDDVVVWQNTIAFLEAAIRAGVDVDYMVYPGELHGLGSASRAHFMRKMTRFFTRRLLDDAGRLPR